ncbi:MAG: GAF domain-containing protein, partial [Chloroflexi bacterium]|nr:GAF domain-containing protein [Chloroflexota bacterium]
MGAGDAAAGNPKPTSGRLQALGELAKVVACTDDRQALSEAALACSLQMLQFEVGSLYEIDQQAGLARLLAHCGLSPSFVSMGTRHIHERVQAVAQSRQPALWDDYYRQAQITDPDLLAEGLGSVAMVPLVSPEGTVGLMNLATRSRRCFSEEERALLATVGEVVGSGLARLRVLEQLHLLRRAVEESADGMAVCDTRGLVVYANSALARIFELPSPDSLVGRLVADFLPDDNGVALRAEAIANLQQQGRWRGEVQVVRGDGSRCAVAASVAGHVDDAGRLVSISLVLRDLTEQRWQQEVWRSLEGAGPLLLRLREPQAIYQAAASQLERLGLEVLLLARLPQTGQLTVAAHSLHPERLLHGPLSVGAPTEGPLPDWLLREG